MQTMRVALISPKGPLYRRRGGIFKKNLRYAPLTLTTLAALAPPELAIEFSIIDEGVADVPPNLEADLVAMTVITGTAGRAYALADALRGRGIPVVLGGPHVTLAPEDAQPHADAVVSGYAEETWPRLLGDFAAGRMQARYTQLPGLDLAGRPTARRDLLRRGDYLTTHTFEATRACIHSCDFCVAPSAWGTKPYQRPVEEVADEIRRHWARRIIFLDLNLIADRDYAAALFEALIPLKTAWFGLATTLLGEDPALLALAVRSGCSGLLMGFESIVPDSLKSARKGFNHPEQFRALTEQLHRQRITLMACFAFGMDSDTPEVFMRTARFAVEAAIDLPRFAIVTPFPNTPLYRRLEAEGRITSHDWQLYDGQHVVFQPAQMSAAQLYAGHEQAWKHCYSAGGIARRFVHSRIQLPAWWVANLGYRFYAHHLGNFYNCDWIVAGP